MSEPGEFPGEYLGVAPSVLVEGDALQSALAPRGPAAAYIADLTWVLFAGGTAVFLVTMAMFAFGLIWPDRAKRLRPIHLIAWGGLAFPAVTLLLLTFYTTYIGGQVDLGRGQDAGRPPLQVHVTGHMWWWEVAYPEEGGGAVVTANEIHVPVGRRVEIALTTADVIHSLWIPTLHGKMDLIPGRTNVLTVQASEPGVVRGQCAEFCGLQHALMSFWVVAHPPEEFEEWLAAQRRPADEPEAPDLVAGRNAFLDAGCGSCHRVAGLAEGPYAATGQVGPDLTHVGSRLSLAGATLPNGVGPLAGWIADAQDIKPGNRMPSYHHLDGGTLTAVARYLESLK